MCISCLAPERRVWFYSLSPICLPLSPLSPTHLSLTTEPIVRIDSSFTFPFPPPLRFPFLFPCFSLIPIRFLEEAAVARKSGRQWQWRWCIIPGFDPVITGLPDGAAAAAAAPYSTAVACAPSHSIGPLNFRINFRFWLLPQTETGNSIFSLFAAAAAAVDSRSLSLSLACSQLTLTGTVFSFSFSLSSPVSWLDGWLG